MRRIAKVLLTTAAILAFSTTTVAAADASPLPKTAMVGEAHLDARLGGLRAVVHADKCGIYEGVTGRLLGIKQGLAISC